MKTLTRALVALIVASVALPALADQIKGTWGGAASTDPLHGYVDWTMIDTSVCWVGRPPMGYEGRSYRAKVTNKTDRPITLTVDGSQVDVVKASTAGGNALPWMILINVGGTEYRRTALFPGDTCYLPLPGKSMMVAQDDGWKVAGSVAEPLNGLRNSWTPVQGSNGLMGYLNQGGFEDLGACELERLKYRGRELPVVFDKLEDFNDGC